MFSTSSGNFPSEIFTGRYVLEKKENAQIAIANIAATNFNGRLSEKGSAASVPNAAAITTDPLPPNFGIVKTMSKQPSAAPARSNA